MGSDLEDLDENDGKGDTSMPLLVTVERLTLSSLSFSVQPVEAIGVDVSLFSKVNR